MNNKLCTLQILLKKFPLLQSKIINEKELDAFMEMEFEYKRFIVQSLIGNYNWTSTSEKGKFYHVGTIPNAKGNTYVTDLRMMISTTEDGLKPAFL